MKSMFSMGFFSNDVFQGRDGLFLGASAADGNAYLSALAAAFAQYQQATSWMAANPNWKAILGSEASYFQDLSSAAQQDSVQATSMRTLLQGDPTAFDPSSPAKGISDAFISEANSMLEIISRHPVSVPGAAPGAAPAASTTSSLQTPLLIAGGFLVAAVAIVLLRPS